MPAHKLEFLALKWVVTESFQECLYGNTIAVYSDQQPSNLWLDHGQAGCHWTSVDCQACQVQFHHPLPLQKISVNADALSMIPLDQDIKVDAVGAIFGATVDGPEVLMTISPLILESPPTQMTAMEWVWAQKTDPVISQVTTWIENGKLSIEKVSEEMSQRVK